MDVERVTELVAASSEGAGTPDSIRITRHGKLRVWVKKALDFFEVRFTALETANRSTLAEPPRQITRSLLGTGRCLDLHYSASGLCR